MSEVYSSAFVCNIWAAFIFFLASSSTAQTTDPSEVSALNSIFAQWNIKADTRHWNTTGDPCSGIAGDTTTSFHIYEYNPFIKCDCSFNSSSICHITQLKVYALDVTGPIPEELWSLRFLFNLNLAQNYLSGFISPSIRNLPRLQYLSIGINALSGKLPKEMGELTELLVLSISNNNFTGLLPSELGNLSKLEQLYIDSSGVGGEIPSTFSNLTNLQTLWASDVEFTGRIPDLIANWSNLTTLRLQGNSFEGPIPLSLANLTSLKELRLSDASDGGTSLELIKNMKSLHVLVLRNNNITGSIPSTIGEYQSLQELDLSFNKLSGQIPESLINLSSLTNLFLGNNSLSGSLPQRKSRSLGTIDLSYNNFNGSFPSWVEEQNLQLNLVGNRFFKVKSTKNGALPRGLNCLQQNFPCNRGRGIYYNSGINCGGAEVRPSSGVVYERDDEVLHPATYYVASTQRWAVSNVGLFAGNTNQSYTSELAIFQTSRLSASSVRYYGIRT